MSSGYQIPSRRGPVVRLVQGIDDFMNWLQYGYETWLVALIKGVTLFLFIYFLLFYIPNYVYYAVTLFVLDFSKDVGFLVANMIGGGNFVLLIILAVWTQAARGRSGFGWSLIRYVNFLQLLAAVLVVIPFMVFNLAGGSLIPPIFTFSSIALGALSAGIGAAALVYLYFEYRRITRREATSAAAAAAALSPGA